jgi:hypothetical protein
LEAAPHTAAALAGGGLSVDQADLVTRAHQPEWAERFAKDEETLVTEVSRRRFPDGVRFVQHWIEQARRNAGVPPPGDDDRHLTVTRGPGDRVELTGSLPPVPGSAVRAELDRLEQILFDADWATARATHGRKASPDCLGRTRAQRRADALVEMARRSRALPEDNPLPRPLITVVLGQEALASVCELAEGTVIGPHQVIPLLAEAEIERIVFDGPSRVIEVGERQRFFTGALRRAIEVRDRHCQHPSGCDVPAERCHVDHVVPYAQGGLTTQDNGRLHCPVHNRRRVGRPDDGPPPPDDG